MSLLLIGTELVFLFIFAAMLIESVRRPRRDAIDAALFAGVLTYIFSIRTVLAPLGLAQSNIVLWSALIALMAVPYLLLRLADDYHRIRVAVLRGTLIVFGVLLVPVLVLAVPYPPALVNAVALYFVVVLIYATVAFVREARTAAGLTRIRMSAIAAATALLTVAIGASSATTAVAPAGAGVVAADVGSVGILIAAGMYYFGFAPPRPLRRLAQEAGLRAFIRASSSLAGMQAVGDVLRRVEVAAAAAMGVASATVAEYDLPHQRMLVTMPDGEHIAVPLADSISGWVATSKRPTMSLDPTRDFPKLSAVYERYGITVILAAPILINDRLFGTLAVQGRRHGLFAQDDLELLAVLAAQAATVIENAQLLAEVGRLTGEERRRGFEAQARLAAIVGSSTDAIIGATPDGIVTDWNPGAERLFGYGANEIVGTVVRLAPLDRVTESIELLARIKQGERVEHFETVSLRKDGRHVEISMSVAPILDEVGTVVGVATIARDITDLRASEARVRAMVDVSLDAVIAMDQNGNVIEWSQQAAKLFGWSREEAFGRPMADLVLPERNRAPHRAALEQLRRSGDRPAVGDRAEIVAITREGREFPCEMAIAVVTGPSGQIFCSFVRDLTDVRRAETERKELEARLSQSERLESIGRLVGGIGHDFNNLMAVILNYTDFIAARLAPADPSADDLVQIRAAAERAARFTRQLLTFARRQAVHPENMDLGQLVRGLEGILRGTLRENIAIELSLASDLWSIRADRGQIEQMILNLVVNAGDAMPEGGVLRVSSENAPHDQDSAAQYPDLAPGRYVLLTVTDTGQGMSKEVLDRAFEPFFTTKPQGKGTGLGLATVYGVVRQQEGRISISSDVGKGTRVRVLLPAVTEAAPAAVPADLPIADRAARKATILLVEDEDAVREAARRILTRAGYLVIAANRPEAAFEALGDGLASIDLVVTDMVMPGMSGRELVRRLRAERSDLRVVYMTGYSEELTSRHEEAIEGPILGKPFTREPLLAIVGRELEPLLGVGQRAAG